MSRFFCLICFTACSLAGCGHQSLKIATADSAKAEMDFSLDQARINGIPLRMSLAEVRKKYGKEDSVSNAVWHDEADCYTNWDGDSETRGEFHFFKGIAYVKDGYSKRENDSVQFQSLDFTNPKMQSPEVVLPRIKVTAKTTERQLFEAYPGAYKRNADGGQAGEELYVFLEGKVPEWAQEEALVFEFRNGQLMGIHYWYDCT